jgi:hypothetical protein
MTNPKSSTKGRKSSRSARRAASDDGRMIGIMRKFYGQYLAKLDQTARATLPGEEEAQEPCK